MSATLEAAVTTDAAHDLHSRHYLLLIRENYLEADAEVDVREVFDQLIDSYACSGDAVTDFIAWTRDVDWRTQVVGLHGLIVMRCRGWELERETGSRIELSSSPHWHLATRPKLLTATILDDRTAIESVLRAVALDEDSLDTYAAACAAAALLQEHVDLAILADVMRDRVRDHPFYESGAFAASEQRFRRAYDYWSHWRDD